MQNKPEQRLHAGFFVRLAAFLIDSLIVGAALLMVRIPLWISSIANPGNLVVRDFIFRYSVADIVVYILSVVYFIALTYKTGATLGKKVLHLKVVSVEERDPTLFEIVFRETVGRFLSTLVLNVGYIMVGLHKEKHGLHDMLSDTEVIYYHEKKIYADVEVFEKHNTYNDYVTPSYVQKAIEKEPE